MLALSIVALIVEYVAYIIGSALIYGPNGVTNCWIVLFIILVFSVISVFTMVSGISNIKDRSIRGRAISTTAVSAVGVLSGLILVICELFVIAVASNA